MKRRLYDEVVMMDEIEIGYLTIIDLGGDPYNEKHVLRVIDVDFGTSEKYKVKTDFTQDSTDVMNDDVVCPLCKKHILVNDTDDGFICTECAKLIGLE